MNDKNLATGAKHQPITIVQCVWKTHNMSNTVATLHTETILWLFMTKLETTIWINAN